MLSTDEIILDILSTAKLDKNPLLSKFKISYPDNNLAEENNCIFVAVVSTENNLDTFEGQTFTDLVEILVVTKQKDNRKTVSIIKTVANEICSLILSNADKFPNKPVIRNINPFFDWDLVLSRGQIMVNVNTEPTDFKNNDADIEYVCGLLSDDTIIEFE